MADTSAQSPPATVQTILAEARRLFAERGFDGVSISDLAGAAGVSKANIFHHFGAKQTLYVEALKDCINEVSQFTDRLVRDEAPLDQRLHRFMLAHALHLQESPEAAQMVLRELLENRSDVTQQLAEEVTGAQFRRLHELLREAQEAGEIRREVDPTALMLVMIGVVVFLFQVRSLLSHQPEVSFTEDPELYCRFIADILMHGVSSEGSES